MTSIENRYCPICTRTFWGDAINFDGDVCHYCQVEIEKGKCVGLVALEMRQKLEALSPAAMRKAIREAAARDSEE